jgi:hypothetical protein
MWLPDMRDAKDFLRTELQEGGEIRSIVWAPFGKDVVEFG